MCKAHKSPNYSGKSEACLVGNAVIDKRYGSNWDRWGARPRNSENHENFSKGRGQYIWCF